MFFQNNSFIAIYRFYLSPEKYPSFENSVYRIFVLPVRASENMFVINVVSGVNTRASKMLLKLAPRKD